jgi:hypothetical protein
MKAQVYPNPANAKGGWSQLFGWIKKKGLEAVTKAHRADLEKYITILKGMSGEEIGFLVAGSTIFRVINSSGVLPAQALDLSARREEVSDFVPIALNREIQRFQKEKRYQDAAMIMPWLHSVRALNDLELRLLGREMWAEMARGFQYAEEGLDQLKEMVRLRLPEGLEAQLFFVPVGLEPNHR